MGNRDSVTIFFHSLPVLFAFRARFIRDISQIKEIPRMVERMLEPVIHRSVWTNLRRAFSWRRRTLVERRWLGARSARVAWAKDRVARFSRILEKENPVVENSTKEKQCSGVVGLVIVSQSQQCGDSDVYVCVGLQKVMHMFYAVCTRLISIRRSANTASVFARLMPKLDIQLIKRWSRAFAVAKQREERIASRPFRAPNSLGHLSALRVYPSIRQLEKIRRVSTRYSLVKLLVTGIVDTV